MNLRSRRAKIIAGSALAAVLFTGATVAVTSLASADEPSTDAATVTSAQEGVPDDAAPDGSAGGPGAGGADGQAGGPASGQAGGMQGPPPDVEALAGTDLEQVTAAVLAEYPGATVEQAEVDPDGAYRAHVTTAEGDLLLVQLDDSFTVTGATTDTAPGGGALPGGTGGPGAPPGDGTGGAPQDETASTTGT